jgi:large repetitive protein
LLQVFPISNIPGDGSITNTYTFTAQPRTYRFYAVADPENQVTEMYKDNNTAIRALTIKNPGDLLGPDLVPIKIDLTDTITNPQTLAISGTAHVTFLNRGDDKITTPLNVIIFEDRDGDGKYTAGVDNLLGTAANSMTIWPGGANEMDIPLTGTVKFLHSPLYAFVDSGDVIKEQDETNNVMISCKDCQNKPTNPIQPKLLWSWKQPNMGYNINATYPPPIIAPLADTNNDGKINNQDISTIIINSTDNYTDYSNGISTLKAFRGDTGALLFATNKMSDHPIDWTAYLAAGDIDGDGKAELILNRRPINGGALLAFKNDGTFLWDNQAIVTAWNASHAYDKVVLEDNMIPAIADLDGNGKASILAGRAIFNGNGTVRCAFDGRYGGWGQGNGFNYSTVIADVDMDGKPDIVAGNTVYNSDCTIKWWKQALPDGLTAVGNLNDGLYPEIVLATDILSPGPSGLASSRLYLLDHNGNVLWGPIYLSQLIGSSYKWRPGHPIIADFDGDGKPEIGVRQADKYLIFDGQGNLKKTITIPSSSGSNYSYLDSDSARSPLVFDLDGDGRPEILTNTGGYFTILDGKDGTILFQDRFCINYAGLCLSFIPPAYQNVILADVNGDGHAEIVVSGFDNSNFDAIRVYGATNNDWVNARTVWNQASYHVTNVNDDGSIPKNESPSWLVNNTYRTQAQAGTSANPYLTPNLTASLLRADQNGTSVNLIVRIGNGGAKETPPGIVVTFYDGDPLASGVVIGTTATTKILQSGDYQDIAYSTNTVARGLHHIYAVVNSGATAMAECRTDDNQTFMDFTVQEGSADLKIGTEDIDLPESPYYEGSIIPITASVKNTGSVTANNVTVRLYLGSPAAGGVQIGSTRTISSIDANGSANVVFTFDTLGRTGRNVLYIVLDQENTVIESNETNNVAAITITVLTPELPNLAITSDNIQMSSVSVQEGQVVTITASITNRGAAVGSIPVRFSLGDPGSGGQVIADQTVYPILGLGKTATVTATLNTTGLAGQQTVFVTIDSANTIIELSKADNTATKTLFIQSAGLLASVSTDKTAYQRDETLTASVSIANSTGAARSLNLTLYVLDSAGNNIAVITAAERVTVSPNSSAQSSKRWSIGSTLAGNYFIIAEAAEDGRVVSKASAGFSITQDKAIDAKVTTDKISYSPNQLATLTSTVTSKSANYIFENLTAKMTVAGGAGPGTGDALYTETKTISTLMPGAGYTFKSYWSIATNPSGTYPVTLEVRDAANTVIATATQSLVITSDVKPSTLLHGQIAIDRQVLLSGETATINYTVTNVGNIDLTGVSLFIKTVSVDEQTVYDTLTDTASLVKGASYTNTKLLNTGKYGAKDYLVVLRASITGTEETLTGTYLRIEVRRQLLR